jgi:hypothetical protein
MATGPLGFTWHELPAELGSALKLPPWLEPARPQIEAVLPRVEGSEVRTFSRTTGCVGLHACHFLETRAIVHELCSEPYRIVTGSTCLIVK